MFNNLAHSSKCIKDLGETFHEDTNLI